MDGYLLKYVVQEDRADILIVLSACERCISRLETIMRVTYMPRQHTSLIYQPAEQGTYVSTSSRYITVLLYIAGFADAIRLGEV